MKTQILFQKLLILVIMRKPNRCQLPLIHQRLFKKEAVNLYFSVHDGSTQVTNNQQTQQPQIHNHNQNRNTFQSQTSLTRNSIPLNEEQKEYLNKKIKFENRKKEYEKQQPGLLSSSIKNFMSYFTSSNTTASKFIDTLKFKPCIDVLDLDLDKAIAQFDLQEQKSILIIYIKPTICSSNLEKLEQKILQNPRLESLNQKAVFTGVIQSAQTLYKLDDKSLPCFIVIYRNKIDELIESIPIEFNSNSNSENQVLDQIERNVNNAYEYIKHDKRFKKEVKRVIKHNKQILMQSQINNMFQPYLNTNNHQRIIQESERVEQERLLRQFQQQQQNYQNFEQQRKNNQLEEERRLKQEQERKYKEMLQNQQQQSQVQQKEQKQQENKQQKIERLKKKFEDRKLLKENVITFAIRLPNGQRIMQDFDNDTEVQEVYDFVYIQESKGFQDEDHDLEIFSCGFPPQKLEKEKQIKEYFGDSDQEALTIREVFEQLT